MFQSLSLADALAAASRAVSAGETTMRYPTGFSPLDLYLNDGFRPRELILVAGRQGVGKTTFAMQVCRSVAMSGLPVVVLSFEHDDRTLVERLVALEAAYGGVGASLPARRIVERLRGQGTHAPDPVLDDVLAGVSTWAPLVQIVGPTAESPTMSIADIAMVVAEATRRHGHSPLVIVDYLQKIAMEGETDDVRSGRVAVALKELAMTSNCPVLAITAADREGLVAGQRLLIHHLRGAAVLAYESDVILLFNDKYDVVARQHLVYDASNAARMHDVTVVSLEKNRGGLDGVHLQFTKHFESNRYDPQGSEVSEQLVDQRLYD
jgi:replicative DNA helicase